MLPHVYLSGLCTICVTPLRHHLHEYRIRSNQTRDGKKAMGRMVVQTVLPCADLDNARRLHRLEQKQKYMESVFKQMQVVSIQEKQV